MICLTYSENNKKCGFLQAAAGEASNSSPRRQTNGSKWFLGRAVISTLTHWGRVTHICVGNLTIIGPDNGLSPDRRQAIIWTNAGILLIGPWGTNFGEILIGIQTFSFKKMHLKMSSAKWRPFCVGLNVLSIQSFQTIFMNGKFWIIKISLKVVPEDQIDNKPAMV